MMEHNNNTPIPTSGPPPGSSPTSALLRQWRPAAQRNLRNQWSNLLTAKNRWAAAVAGGRTAATALVNAYLSRRYLPTMDLGVLKDMPGIRSKASHKLSCQQELSRSNLLSSYKGMADIIFDMIKASTSMRCFLKGSGNSSLVQFSNYSDDKGDSGDGGGIPVFSSWSLASFEEVAQELVKMFVSELCLKRLLVVELLGISSREDSGTKTKARHWSSELYPGESDDFTKSPLPCVENFQYFPSSTAENWESDKNIYKQENQHPQREVLQVYLTTWISDVNIDMNRVEDIFEVVEDAMQIKLS